MALSEQWLSIYQDDSIGDDCNSSISFAAPSCHISEEVMLSNLIRGLEDTGEIKVVGP